MAIKTVKGGLNYFYVTSHFCFCHLIALSSGKVKLLKEVSIMLSFKHPNVMPLLGLCFDEDMPLLVMPFMSGGSVLGFVKHNEDTLHFVQGTDPKRLMLIDAQVQYVYQGEYVSMQV